MVSPRSVVFDTDLFQFETVAVDALSGHYGDVSLFLGGDGAVHDIYLLRVKSVEKADG